MQPLAADQSSAAASRVQHALVAGAAVLAWHGSALAKGSFNYCFNLQVSAVPEPASAWLLALGLGLAVAAVRRHR